MNKKDEFAINWMNNPEKMSSRNLKQLKRRFLKKLRRN